MEDRDMPKNRKRRLMKLRNKNTGGSKARIAYYAGAGLAVVLLLVYLSGVVYFSGHFFFGTRINGYDCFGKTPEQAEKTLEMGLDSYAMRIEGKGGTEAVIEAGDVSMSYGSSPGLKKQVKKQNTFAWFLTFFDNKKRDIHIATTFDREKLTEVVGSLSILSEEYAEAVSAFPKYDGQQFVIEPEVYGIQIERKIFEEKIGEALSDLEACFDMESEGCYETPAYTKDSPEVRSAVELMNEYCRTSITYTMDENVVLDKATISTWLSTDENMEVIIDENAVKEWLREFGKKYDTVGITRSLTTPTGRQTTVTGGTYGWSVDEEAERSVILEAIKNGETLTREPVYCEGNTAASHTLPDWGNTYIEVDLKEQHMWYIENGAIKLETDVVTGEPIPEKITPEGVYDILEKKLDTYLTGDINPKTGKPIYRTHVDYWMRVTWTGIGFHDAIWQSAFGGSRYQTNGSHGCINMPLDKAAALYDLIGLDVPVIIHY